MINNPLFYRLALLCIIAGTLASCTIVEGRETAGQYVDDSTITSTVKADILADTSLHVLQINVETMQGVVQLSGFVASARDDRRAVEIAHRVAGVKSVEDSLVLSNGNQ